MAKPYTAEYIGNLVEALIKEPRFSEAEMRTIGEFAVNIIVTRTKQGIDAKRQDFKPYSDGYRRDRIRAGYGEKPDLVRTGHMLGNISVVQARANDTTIEFTQGREEQKAKWNQKTREFFAIESEEEKAKIAEVAAEIYREKIERIIAGR